MKRNSQRDQHSRHRERNFVQKEGDFRRGQVRRKLRCEDAFLCDLPHRSDIYLEGEGGGCASPP